jgi:hypothetical protein
MDEHGGKPTRSRPDFTTISLGGVTAICPKNGDANKALNDGLVVFPDEDVKGWAILVEPQAAADAVAKLKREGFNVVEE